MFNLKHVLEGITNSIFVREEVEALASVRYEICKGCSKNSNNKYSSSVVFDPGPYYSTNRPDEHCSMCACNIHAKVRSLHTECPIGKWKAVANKEEAAKIAAAIDDINQP